MHGPFDWVIASDVVFATAFVDPLLSSISSMMNPQSRCAIAHQLRKTVSAEGTEQGDSVFELFLARCNHFSLRSTIKRQRDDMLIVLLHKQ